MDRGATLILGLAATSRSASARVPKKPAEAVPTPPTPAPSSATPAPLDKRIQRGPGSTVRGVGRDDASAVQRASQRPTPASGRQAAKSTCPEGSANADKASPDKANIGGGGGKAGADKADLGSKADGGSDKASIGRDKLDSAVKAGRKVAPAEDKATSTNGPKRAPEDEGASGKAGVGRKVDQTDEAERKTGRARAEDRVTP